MNKWIRKTFVVMVSILTLGLVTPTQLIHNVNADKSIENDVSDTAGLSVLVNQQGDYWAESSFKKEDYVDELVKQAEIQSYQKFGPKIKPIIEQDFREAIMPNIETALQQMAYEYPGEDLQNLEVTEQPGGGRSEKIFHVKNRQTEQDIMRFHVRCDNPPQAGYWFNFHYHTYHDQFQTHHELGVIYWDKNTPPKWTV